MLRTPQLPPLDAMLTLLINDIAAIQKANLFLVLDDYHVIEIQAIHDSLAFFLDHLPPQMHIVITSRADPPLPLPRLRVRQQLTEVHTADLRFTPNEAAILLNQVMGLSLSADDVAALETRTEGWIAGLQLAAISMKGQTDTAGFLAAFTGSHHYVLDYLAEEVLQQQPEQVQTFLLQTSVLDRMNAPLCNAVTNRNDSQTMLEQLAHHNLFIVPLDNQRRWYRYHRLFADLLRHYLRQSSPATEITGLHRLAASWYKQEGLIDEAVSHALAGEDFEQAQHLIEQNSETMFMRGEMVALRRWLEAFPPAQLQARPLLGIIYAWALFFAGELGAASQHLDQAEQKLDSVGLSGDETQIILAISNALRAQFALMHGEITRTIELSQQALDNLPQETLALRSIIALNLGTAHWLNGDPQTADKIMAEAAAIGRITGDTASILVANTNLAEMQTIQGKLTQAEQLYQRVLQLADTKEEYHLSSFVGRAYVGLGGILYERNKLEAAVEYLNKGLELGRQSADMHTILGGHLNLALVLQTRGSVDQAHNILQQARQLSPGYGPGLVPVIINVFQTRLWLAQGNLAAATQWVQESNLSHKDPVNDLHEFQYVTLARVLLARDEPDAAATLLNRLLEMAQVAERTRSVIEILTLQALTYQVQSKTEQALSALQQALTLAEPEGYIRIFTDEGASLTTLLLKFIERHQKSESISLPTTDYLQKVLAALGVGEMVSLEDKTSRSAQALVEPLTERELEILQLIADGLANKDIADQLIIAVSTVKTHTKNIYGKLGVNSRIQAVAKAKELNLL